MALKCVGTDVCMDLCQAATLKQNQMLQRRLDDEMQQKAVLQRRNAQLMPWDIARSERWQAVSRIAAADPGSWRVDAADMALHDDVTPAPQDEERVAGETAEEYHQDSKVESPPEAQDERHSQDYTAPHSEQHTVGHNEVEPRKDLKESRREQLIRAMQSIESSNAPQMARYHTIQKTVHEGGPSKTETKSDVLQLELSKLNACLRKCDLFDFVG